MHIEVQQAYNDITEAENRLRDAISTELEAGTSVSWLVRGHSQYGRILRCVGKDRVEVENDKTGTRQLLHAYWFLPKHGGYIF